MGLLHRPRCSSLGISGQSRSALEWSGSSRAADLVRSCLDRPEDATPAQCFSLLTGTYQSGELGPAGEAIVDEYESSCGAVWSETFFYAECGHLLDRLREHLVQQYGAPPASGAEPSESPQRIEDLEIDAGQISELYLGDFLEVVEEHEYGEYVIAGCDRLYFDDGIGPIDGSEQSYQASSAVTQEFESAESLVVVVTAVFAKSSDASTVVRETVQGANACILDAFPDGSYGAYGPAAGGRQDVDEAHLLTTTAVGSTPESTSIARVENVVTTVFARSGTGGPRLDATRLATAVLAAV